MKMHSGLDPRCVKEPDEDERQHDQEQHNAGEENHYTEKAPQIAVESDVAKTKGGHDSESPVHARDPGVLLPFEVVHDKAEACGKDRNCRYQQERIAYKSPDIWAGACRDK